VHLLDVNALIALCDHDHPHSASIRSWFGAHARQGWATCPLTENGILRIMGHVHYQKGPGSPAGVLVILKRLLRLPKHHFWADSITLTDLPGKADLDRVSSNQLTDIYLLSLAVAHGGRLVTFDKHIDPAMVDGGRRALLVLS
jgi:uncharacterized protein